jgi:hypothetical protein
MTYILDGIHETKTLFFTEILTNFVIISTISKVKYSLGLSIEVNVLTPNICYVFVMFVAHLW